MSFTSRGSAAGLVVAALGAASPCHASGALEINGAPTSSSGMTSRALGRHAETAYFNPALLPRSGPLIEIGYFVVHTRGDIELAARPAGVNVPESLYGAELRDASGNPGRLELRPLATEDLPNTRRDTHLRDTSSYALIGLSRPLFNNALTFGLYAILPTRGVLSQDGFFSDEREQFFSNQLDFEMLGDRSGITSFALALGSELWPWLGVGVGANMALSTTTRFEVYVPDAADQRTVLLNPDMTTSASFAPYIGVALHPSDYLTMSATVHSPVSADVSGENLLRFWNYTYPDDEEYVRQTYIFSQAYQPLRLGIGIGWTQRPNQRSLEGWELGAQAVLRRWSQYQDRHGQHPEVAFSNTIDVSVGGVRHTDIGSFSLDFGYVPSPVPDQVGRSNYVDNHRLTTMATWETPIEMFGSPTGVGVYAQAQFLVPRSVKKDLHTGAPVLDEFPDSSTDFLTGDPIPEAAGLQTNNPGYPGYESSGWLLGVGLAFRLPQ